MISIFNVFFPLLSNGVGSFPEIFHFHLHKIQNVLYLQNFVFNIFFSSLDGKLRIFSVRKDIFNTMPEMLLRELECERVDAPPFLPAVLSGTVRGLRPPRYLQ